MKLNGIGTRVMVSGVLATAVVATCFCVAPGCVGQVANAEKPVDFDHDIRPILAENCYACHGPDEKVRMASLHFDTREGAFAKPGVIEPGNSQGSRLIQRITHTDPAMHMPPPVTGKALTSTQIGLLRRWIDEGASWNLHWAFQAPRRPPLPEVKDKSWPNNPIDSFILARLEREGLRPSPEADKATLLRRVSLDLTGLPPTLAELDSFLADLSPGAYEKRVDQLLQSPHYGERMTMQWLDLARYADTHGYHIDSMREMWHWRDWVIRAYQQNMPYDRFTIDQLAGDLLPNATLDEKIASGFNRNHMINFEGGAIPEEYQVEYVVDRVEATSNTWMGLTMGCARCHNHKFDPITQKDFYRFFAFFNNVAEEGLDGRTGNAKPVLQLPSAHQKELQDRLEAAIRVKESALSDKEIGPLLEGWEKQFIGKLPDVPRKDLAAWYELDGNFSDISGGYHHGRCLRGDPTFGSGRVGKAVSLDGDTEVVFPNVGAFDRPDSFGLAFWLKGEGNTPLRVLEKLQADSAEFPDQRRGYELMLDDLQLIGIQKRAARIGLRLISRWPGNAIQIQSRERISLGDWHHLAFSYDGSGRAAGLCLFVDGLPADVEVIQDNLTGSFANLAELRIGGRQFGNAYRGQLDDLRLFSRALSADEIRQMAIDYPVFQSFSGITGKRTKDEAARIRDYFLTQAAPEGVRADYAELQKLRKQRDELEKIIPTTMVMDELKKPRETFILERGDYRNRGDKVEPGVPTVLPPLPKDAHLNRLALAEWLVDPSHPLTARVAVNRYWQMYFGIGIVKTAEDFGTQGDRPSHPELLDWLATEFIRSGWDIRAMQRLIVTSATYRQSSRVTHELLERDPENRLVARGPRFRLPAEMVRDNALAVSGLLNPEIGGASVFPYQPKGLWEETSFGDGFSAQSYAQSTASNLYRRSMYSFWKRTVPPPSLSAFDAPDREKCTARRSLTNTPLQALVLLNDPTYIEAARALATHALTEGGRETSSRIAYAFRRATGRKPSPAESAVLRELYLKELDHYRRDAKAAADLLGVGESPAGPKLSRAELAAWTLVSSAILNLDETITRQ
jgi:hypothetical protein